MKMIYKDLQQNLLKYADNYRKEISTNKEARAKFSNLCQEMGIDPVVSKKSMWGNIFGDYYNEVAVQILRLCEKTKSTNGGLIKIKELVSIYNRTYPQNCITSDDVIKCLAKIKDLGTGCQIVRGNFISTVPFELNEDNEKLIELAEKKGHVSSKMIHQEYGWVRTRIELAIVSFFFPELFLDQDVSRGNDLGRQTG
jgi:ESCRT-II complex subunit VPS22